MWLGVDKDGTFRLFDSKPFRWHKFDKITTVVENPYGREIEITKDDLSKPHDDTYWSTRGYRVDELVYLEGIKIKKESLNEELQKLTWADEPVEI
jgi:hypothetical protein